MKKVLSIIFTVILCVALSVIIVFAAFTLFEKASHAASHKQILSGDYEETSVGCLYVGHEIDKDDCVNRVLTVLEKIPAGLTDIIIDDWIIVVSRVSPIPSNFSDQSLLRGTVYHGQGLIWLHPDFTEAEFVHECGHVLDRVFGDVSYLDGFRSLYREKWSSYRPYNQDEIDQHSVSNSAEFFASLFSDYICYPEHLNAVFPEAYSYMESVTSGAWKYKIPGRFCGFYVLLGTAVADTCETYYNRIFGGYKPVDIKLDVEQNAFIDMEHYKPLNRISEEPLIVQEIVRLVLDVLSRPDDFEECPEFQLSEHVDFDEYLDASGYLMIYFGVFDENIIDMESAVDGQTPSKLSFDKKKILKYEELRISSLAHIENILLKTHEGSEYEKLLQIADFIISNSSYSATVSESSVNDFWERGYGNCCTYAILFKQFVERLGIQCDVVVSPLGNGSSHAFNRVVLGNGAIRYYDLTRPQEYLHSETIDMICYKSNEFLR